MEALTQSTGWRFEPEDSQELQDISEDLKEPLNFEKAKELAIAKLEKRKNLLEAECEAYPILSRKRKVKMIEAPSLSCAVLATVVDGTAAFVGGYATGSLKVALLIVGIWAMTMVFIAATVIITKKCLPLCEKTYEELSQSKEVIDIDRQVKILNSKECEEYFNERENASFTLLINYDFGQHIENQMLINQEV